MTQLLNRARSAFAAAWIQSSRYSADLFAPNRTCRKLKFALAVLSYPTSLLMTLPAAVLGDLHMGGANNKKSPSWMFVLSKKGDQPKRVRRLSLLIAIPLLPFIAMATVILVSGSGSFALALMPVLSIYLNALIGIAGLLFLGMLLLILPPERRLRKGKDGNRPNLKFTKHDREKSPLEKSDYEVTALAALPGTELPMEEVVQAIDRLLPTGTRVAVSARAPYLLKPYKRWFTHQYRKNKLWGSVPITNSATRPVSSDASDTAFPVSISLPHAGPESAEAGSSEPEVVVEFRAKKGKSDRR